MDKQNKKQLIIFSVIIPIIISLIYEKMLSPFFDVSIEKFLSIGNVIIQYFADLIYLRISNGNQINISYYLFLFASSWVIGNVLVQFLLLRKTINHTDINKCSKKQKSINTENDPDQEIKDNLEALNSQITALQETLKKDESTNNFNYKFTLFWLIFLWVLYIISTILISYIDNTILKTKNNIEIVSPYISDYDYKMLKSNFYSMNSQEDYLNLTALLESIASENSIDLK